MIQMIKVIKKFDDNPSNASRAVQIWQILISKAHNRQTITYGNLADLMGFKGAGVLAEKLGHIMHFCDQNDLPPLTVLVVNRITGKPGEGLTANEDFDVERENVFKHNWYGLYPPSKDEFDEAWKKRRAVTRMRTV